MTLEDRLSEALHQVDAYQPSTDLFVRTKRSIEEDRAHRRRLLSVATWTVIGCAAIVAFFGTVVTRPATGHLAIPRWSAVVVGAAISIVAVIALAPMIRRFGQPFVMSAFQVSPGTGTRFSRLLDIGYYLFFGGLIVVDLDVSGLDSVVSLNSALTHQAGLIARLMAVMGVAHAFNLLAIPVVGLVFGSVTRRARRRAAGPAAPTASAAALQADRVASWIVYSLGAALLAGLLVAIGLLVGGFLAG